MPGLKQTLKVTNNRLKTNLEKYGYEPMRHTPALWIHASRNIVLVLAVDSFGVKYTNRPDAEHLKNALQIVYSMTTDWKGLKKM